MDILRNKPLLKMLKMIGLGRFNGLRCNLLDSTDKTWQREGEIEMLTIHDDGKRIELSLEVTSSDGSDEITMRSCFEIDDIALVQFKKEGTCLKIRRRGHLLTAMITDPRIQFFAA